MGEGHVGKGIAFPTETQLLFYCSALRGAVVHFKKAPLILIYILFPDEDRYASCVSYVGMGEE